MRNIICALFPSCLFIAAVVAGGPSGRTQPQRQTEHHPHLRRSRQDQLFFDVYVKQTGATATKRVPDAGKAKRRAKSAPTSGDAK